MHLVANNPRPAEAEPDFKQRLAKLRAQAAKSCLDVQWLEMGLSAVCSELTELIEDPAAAHVERPLGYACEAVEELLKTVAGIELEVSSVVDWLDDAVEFGHAVLPLAILGALIEALARNPAENASMASVPRSRSDLVDSIAAVSCDNYI